MIVCGRENCFLSSASFCHFYHLSTIMMYVKYTEFIYQLRMYNWCTKSEWPKKYREEKKTRCSFIFAVRRKQKSKRNQVEAKTYSIHYFHPRFSSLEVTGFWYNFLTISQNVNVCLAFMFSSLKCCENKHISRVVWLLPWAWSGANGAEEKTHCPGSQTRRVNKSIHKTQTLLYSKYLSCHCSTMND